MKILISRIWINSSFQSDYSPIVLMCHQVGKSAQTWHWSFGLWEGGGWNRHEGKACTTPWIGDVQHKKQDNNIETWPCMLVAPTKMPWRVLTNVGGTSEELPMCLFCSLTTFIIAICRCRVAAETSGRGLPESWLSAKRESMLKSLSSIPVFPTVGEWLKLHCHPLIITFNKVNIWLQGSYHSFS